MVKKPSSAQIAQRLTKLLDELQAASLCYGAVHHRAYTDRRKAQLKKKGQARLAAAAKAYHAYVIALTFVR